MSKSEELLSERIKFRKLMRPLAQEEAGSLLADLIGRPFSDTALRVTTDHILQFACRARAMEARDGQG